jgi:uncharacterized cupin superfamily protein
MFFHEGGATLTSANGEKMEIGAGEAIIIPKQWTNVWETHGYTKIYLIYSADSEVE